MGVVFPSRSCNCFLCDSQVAVVQDFSQRGPMELADLQPGEHVLDVCSAPGGKTVAACDMQAQVIASDRNLSRLQKVPQPVPRVVQDGCKPAMKAAFSAVLLDAPCS